MPTRRPRSSAGPASGTTVSISVGNSTLWGRLRRAIESDADNLDASVENYDDVLVTLLGDVATNYVHLPHHASGESSTPRRTSPCSKTWRLSRISCRPASSADLDVDQARSTLEQTEAGIPELEIALRQAANQLCILLGIPPQDLQARLGAGSIPTAPPEVAVGIPADLLRRRPDVRRAERQAAAQSGQIGIAEAEFYPAVSINGTIGYSAQNFKQLFRQQALDGQRRPGVHVEHPQLRPPAQQCPPPGSPVPGVGDHLPEQGAQRRAGRGERAGDIPAGPAAGRAGRQRGRRQARPWTSWWPNTRRA